MKIRLVLSIIIIAIITSCSKEDRNCDNPLDCLPEATQTGENTAGCLVNGSVFTPGGQSLNSGSVLKAQYNFYQGSHLFAVSINDLRSHSKTVSFRIRSQEIEEGKTYELHEISSISDSANYLDEILGGYRTTETITGELFISKLNKTKRIVAGTFWFDAANNEGEIIEVRQGRFDVKYY